MINFLFVTFVLILLAGALSTGYAAELRHDITAIVQENLQRLLYEEDTDKDNKITVDDHFIEGPRGDKKFFVRSADSVSLEVAGTYYLSNLLQELTLVKERGDEITRLDVDKIFENPVSRISRNIRDVYWGGLTRSIDEANLTTIFNDSKTASDNGIHYIYVPSRDTFAYTYFYSLIGKFPGVRISVVQLPKTLRPKWIVRLKGRHGILSLSLKRNPGGKIEGVPFVVPGGRFNEMYGWDSYFEALGLLHDGKVDLAQAMVDNFVYEIRYYGKILNANRTYYLTRSQPPFLTSMALAVFAHLPKMPESKRWLKTVFNAAIHEYRNVWMGKNRLTKTGLSRYYGAGIGPPPEVEPGHFTETYRFFAEKRKMNVSDFTEAVKNASLRFPALDSFFMHDRSMRESGHDKTYRWNDRCADFCTVDLNSLLYKIETDIAQTIKKEFNDSFVLDNRTLERSSPWYERAERRKKLMNKLLWSAEFGRFSDYDFVYKRTSSYISATAFYPLWAGLASKGQADSIVKSVMPSLEMPGGLAASALSSRGPISETRPARQWDYPYGWAPHQMLAWRGLINYGYQDIAYRLIYRWLYTITRNAVDYNGTIPEKFDVVHRTHRVFAEYGNVGTTFSYITKEGFGWMNASYQVGLEMLPKDLRKKLDQLIPPEWIFR